MHKAPVCLPSGVVGRLQVMYNLVGIVGLSISSVLGYNLPQILGLLVEYSAG